VPDQTRPLTDTELADFERAAIALHEALRVEAVEDPGKAVIESAFVMISLRLVVEVRRLRELLDEVEPYVSIALTPPGLAERLRAEIGRDGR